MWSSSSPSVSGRPTPPGFEGVSVRVHPALIPRSHPLAGVREAFNAVFVEADAAGQLMFYGRGAGATPRPAPFSVTFVAAARHRVPAAEDRGVDPCDLPILPMGDCVTRYHISLTSRTVPACVAQVASAFAGARCVDRDGPPAAASGVGAGRRARAVLVIVTHRAPDAALSATVAAPGAFRWSARWPRSCE